MPNNSYMVEKQQTSSHSLTLLVLAAGMGSRFGGCKQIEAVGPNGEIILGYSLYDAWKAGFSRAVLVVRKEIESWLRENLCRRWGGRVDLSFVEQRLDDLPRGTDVSVAVSREKPWGTGHAVWSARKAVAEPFMVVNADDFYGRETYQMVAQFLRSEEIDQGEKKSRPVYGLAGYRLAKTLSPHGAVARGVCRVEERTDELIDIEEVTGIEQDDSGMPIKKEEGGVARGLDPNTCVSLNAWAFTPSFFGGLEERFKAFLEKRGEDCKAEFYLPAAVSELKEDSQCRVRVLHTPADWFGMTYKDDLPQVRNHIRKNIKAGVYPREL